MSVGSFKNWVSLYGDVKLSSFAPSGVVLSVEHHLFYLALSAPWWQFRKGFFCVSTSRVKSKL